MRQWTWAQVRARRLARHRLLGRPASAEPADVVAAVVAVHAQVQSAAELSIGLRAHGITTPQVQQALWGDRSLVKGFGPRGTVHLFAAADLPMWTGALGAVPNASGPVDGVRLTPGELDEVVAAIGEALSGGACLTVDELGAAVLDRSGAWAGELTVPAFGGMWPRWRLAISAAGHRGMLCFGPQRGRLVTYTGPANWLPGFGPDEPAAALAAVVCRYLTAFGPATSDHFAQWLAAPRRWAAELFASMASQLTAVVMAGRPAWLVRGDAEPPTERARGIRLLPYFDAYIVGSHPRPLLFPGTAATRALSGTGQAGTVPVVLLSGEVAGVWHLRRAGRRLNFTVELLRELSTRHRTELGNEVERTAAVLQGSATLNFGTIPTAHHL